jgi:uncharacterized C2H2 Zn-finger protein
METPPFKCSNCNEIFDRKMKYLEHTRLEACVVINYIDKKEYDTYEKIPSFFSDYVSFKKLLIGTNHQYKTTDINDDGLNEQNYKCELCDNTFSRMDSLSRHTNKFCKVKKELEHIMDKNPNILDDKTNYDRCNIEEFKQSLDEILQTYFPMEK